MVKIELAKLISKKFLLLALPFLLVGVVYLVSANTEGCGGTTDAGGTNGFVDSCE